MLVFFLAPAVVWARDLIGWKVPAALLIAGLVGLAVVRTRAITGIYRLTVGEASIEVRTGLRARLSRTPTVGQAQVVAQEPFERRAPFE